MYTLKGGEWKVLAGAGAEVSAVGEEVVSADDGAAPRRTPPMMLRGSGEENAVAVGRNAVGANRSARAGARNMTGLRE